ncbi:hypothetical protein BsWGS_22980 [Bradybaena similaris]
MLFPVNVLHESEVFPVNLEIGKHFYHGNMLTGVLRLYLQASVPAPTFDRLSQTTCRPPSPQLTGFLRLYLQASVPAPIVDTGFLVSVTIYQRWPSKQMGKGRAGNDFILNVNSGNSITGW